MAVIAQPREVAYVTAGRLLDELVDHYERFCIERRFPFERHLTLSTPPPGRPDDTLFLVAGMQRYRERFRDPTHVGTVCNVQRVLRVDDLDNIGAGTHHLSFDMLGMFSFRELTVPTVVELWWRWLGEIGVRPEVVTVHPDRVGWSELHVPHGPQIRVDPGCTWSDGDITGYCTEFFVDGVEIGNIVNPMGDCIDVGFGLDRLVGVLGEPMPPPEEILREAVVRLLDGGFLPGSKRQGYVLRRLLRRLVREGISLDHPVFRREVERQQRLRERYLRLRPHHPDASPQWWWETHGIDVNEV
jgi:alanyl-tRNA synthetase